MCYIHMLACVVCLCASMCVNYTCLDMAIKNLGLGVGWHLFWKAFGKSAMLLKSLPDIYHYHAAAPSTILTPFYQHTCLAPLLSCLCVEAKTLWKWKLSLSIAKRERGSVVKLCTNILVCKALSEYKVRVQILLRRIIALSLYSHSAHHHQKEGLLWIKVCSLTW